MAIAQNSKIVQSDIASIYSSFNTFISNYGGSITQLTTPTQYSKVEAKDINNLNNKLNEFKSETYLSTQSSWWVPSSTKAIGDLILAGDFTNINSSIANFSKVKCRNNAYNSHGTNSNGNNSNGNNSNGNNSNGNNSNGNNSNGNHGNGNHGNGNHGNGSNSNGNNGNGSQSNGDNTNCQCGNDPPTWGYGVQTNGWWTSDTCGQGTNSNVAHGNGTRSYSQRSYSQRSYSACTSNGACTSRGACSSHGACGSNGACTARGACTSRGTCKQGTYIDITNAYTNA